MTDQTIPEVTDDERVLAREWAAYIESDMIALSNLRTRAAARVILNTVPAPPRPTLAGMNGEERYECRRMQADVRGEETRPVIVNPYWTEGTARVMWPGGLIEEINWERVAPRPDLPRMEWPGDQNPAPSPALPEGWRLADHEDRGRVIVTTPTPDDDGDFYFAFPVDDLTGYDWDACRPDELTFLDQGAADATD